MNMLQLNHHETRKANLSPPPPPVGKSTDFGGEYLEIMEVCQSFYDVCSSPSSSPFHIPARLEDGLLLAMPEPWTAENPQDGSG
jgi:hypothetical protein